MARRDFYTETGKQVDRYSDFHHSFIPSPGNGQIGKKVNVDAVKMAVRNLVLTDKYERPGNPSIGCNVRGSLFDLMDGGSEAEIEGWIRDVIDRFEPRVDIEEINVNANHDGNEVRIDLLFSVKTIPEIQNLELKLIRDR